VENIGRFSKLKIIGLDQRLLTDWESSRFHRYVPDGVYLEAWFGLGEVDNDFFLGGGLIFREEKKFQFLIKRHH